MGYRAHVQSKHEIEYNHNVHFNWENRAVAEWLLENEVFICGVDEYNNGDEWEIYKEALRDLPESAYHDIKSQDSDAVITADELRAFVKDMLDAPTGDYAYVSWF